MQEKTSKSPSLVAPPAEYDPIYQNQLNNVLRLYFNELDENNRSLLQKYRNASVMMWLSEGSF